MTNRFPRRATNTTIKARILLRSAASDSGNILTTSLEGETRQSLHQPLHNCLVSPSILWIACPAYPPSRLRVYL